LHMAGCRSRAFRLSPRASVSLLGELHDGGDVGVVVCAVPQDALELLVADRGALLAQQV
jgi:hypothetical protein